MVKESLLAHPPEARPESESRTIPFLRTRVWAEGFCVTMDAISSMGQVLSTRPHPDLGDERAGSQTRFRLCPRSLPEDSKQELTGHEA